MQGGGTYEKQRSVVGLQLLGFVLCRLWFGSRAGSFCVPEAGIDFGGSIAGGFGTADTFAVKAGVFHEGSCGKKSEIFVTDFALSF